MEALEGNAPNVKAPLKDGSHLMIDCVLKGHNYLSCEGGILQDYQSFIKAVRETNHPVDTVLSDLGSSLSNHDKLQRQIYI